MFLLQRTMAQNLAGLLKLLEGEYLVAEGLMVSFANRKILLKCVAKIDKLYEKIMLECQSLGENDVLPDSDNVTKSSAIKNKLGFEERVREWRMSAEYAESSSTSGAESTFVSVLESDREGDKVEIDCRTSTCSSVRSHRSSSSVLSQKVKESRVKLRMATFAKELQYEQSQQTEIMQRALAKAEAARLEADMELKRVQDSIKRETLKREKEYEARLAQVEANAWAEVASNRGSVRNVSAIASTGAAGRKLAFSRDVGKGEETTKGLCKGIEAPGCHNGRLDNHAVTNEANELFESFSRGSEVETKPKSIVSLVPRNGGSNLVGDAARRGSEVAGERWRRENYLNKFASTYRGAGPVSCENELQATNNKLGEDRQSACRMKLQVGDSVAQSRLAAGRVEFDQASPVGSSAVAGTRNGMTTVDYPPPKPVIPCYDGDPLMFWTFIRSFDTHIAAKMPNDAARLVYLLQHCSPNVRRGLEHFSRNNVTGYRLARQSLFNEYGQPHIIAYCCEQKLLSCSRLKTKDPNSLRDLSILMDKCLGIMDDLGDFATLNSFGTIQRITGKLPEEMQRDWVRWAFGVLRDTGKQAKFRELVEFVRCESEEANSLYGRSFFSGSKQQYSSSQPRGSATFGVAVSRGKIARSGTSSGIRCSYCKGNHSLASCEDFKGVSRYRRVEFLRRESRCFRCLMKGHVVGDCRSKLVCEVEGCGGRSHHTLLHKYSLENTESVVGPGPSEKVMSSTLSGSTRHEAARSQCYFMTISVKVRYGNETTTTYALLDSGSQRTFCEKGLARRLGASGPREVLPIQTLSSGSDPAFVDGMLIPLSVRSLGRGREVELHEVLTVDKIPLRATAVPTALELQEMQHLKGVELHELQDKTVGLLIGLDNPSIVRACENRYGGEGKPDAMLTALGWTLFGVGSSAQDENRCLHVSSLNNDELCVSPYDNVISCGLDCDNSREDRLALEIMNKSVQLVNGHFQLPLLWRDKRALLPNSRAVAERRLGSLKRRLSRDAQLHQRYAETMQMYIERGYAEPVLEGTGAGVRRWFLPHHPVMNPNKPDKVRIVFDCASRSCGVTLNDLLMQGPQLMNNLVGVLTRFRLGNIALVADIEAMFHQVMVAPEDRDALRFLWWPGGDLAEMPRVYRMAVHLFGATSSPSCASFCLRRVLEECGEDCSMRTKEIISRSFYVDDCLASVSSEEEAVRVIAELRQVLSRCGFNLTKWISNSETVLATIPSENRAEGAKLLSLEGSCKERVLGVQWEVASDCLCVKIAIPNKPYTRRGILAMTHSVFDPLDMVAPVLVEPKLLLRELCNHGWDDQIDDDKIKRWQTWLGSLCQLEGLSIPRCFRPPNYHGKVKYQLHCFGDASEMSYGAVAYLRVADESGRVMHCSFIMGKSHLAPNPRTTIPRLELLAAVTVVRLRRFLEDQLPIAFDAIYLWTDSSAVLQSINSRRKRFPVFVANRLAEIERQSLVSEWRHVPSRLNPADEVSRGVSAQSFVKSSRWLTGPEFLLKPENHWPEQLKDKIDLPDDSPMFERKVNVVSAVISANKIVDSPVDHLIKYFSSWHKLKRAVAWWIRFADYIRMLKVQGSSKSETRVSKFQDISANELREAEIRLVRYDQRLGLPHLVNALTAGKTATNAVCPLSVKKLSPFLESGLVRVGGRLEAAPVEYDRCHPILLSGESYITELIVKHYHEAVGHAGVSHTFSALRARYWILGGSVAVRSVLAKCLSCRRNFRPCEQQIMADLPAARLQVGQPPFFHTGVDLFGPFLVKQGRSVVKRYGCIFTCMTMRAVHLEVVHSLSADSFISALRRFIGRRSNVAHIHSDNGSNFTGADKILKEAIQGWNQHRIGGFLLQREIDWHFNTPRASHFGGAWERLIRSVRKVLRSLYSNATFSEEGLTTLLTEVESVINSRPLTPISFVDGFERPLTPKDLLVLRPDCGLPPVVTKDSDLFFPRRWRHVQRYADLFWKRWVKEYLPSLVPRQKWLDSKPNVRIGNVVILKNDETPRSQWPLGRVINTFADSKGFVRSVMVKTVSGNFKRPISKICVIVPDQETSE